MADRPYRVDLAPGAARQLRKLGPEIQRPLVRGLHALETDPRPPGVKRLERVRGTPLWRIRIGDYRIIYEIHEDRLLVLVVRLGHRGEVYRVR